MHAALGLAPPQVRWTVLTLTRWWLKGAFSTSSLSLSFFVPVRPSSPAHDLEASSKDFKFVLIEKDNASVKETERLVMAKDTGKQFMSAAPLSTSGNTWYYFCSHTNTVPCCLLSCDCRLKWTRDALICPLCCVTAVCRRCLLWGLTAERKTQTVVQRSGRRNWC